jgi:ATP-binding cassette subfamily C protein
MLDDFLKLYRILTPAERRRAAGVLALMVLAAGLQVLGVGAIQPFLSLVTDPSVVQESGILASLYEAGGFNSTNRFLGFIGLGTLVLIVFSNAALVASEWSIHRFRWSVNHSLSRRLLKKYLGEDYEFFLDENSSNLSKNMLQEAQQLTSDLLRGALKLVSKGLIAVSLLLLLLYIDPVASLIVLVTVGGGYTLTYLFIRKKLQRIGEEYVEANEERYKVANEAFGSIKDVKLLGREAYFVNRYEPASKRYTRHLGTNHLFKSLPKYVIEALAFGSLMAVLVFYLFANRPVSDIIPLMGMFAFAGYRMLPAFRAILSSLASFRFNKEILAILGDDIRELRETEREAIAPRPEDQEPLPFEDAIELRDVTYSYPSADEPAVRDIDVTVPKDDAIAFVGKTGAGKTTLVDILLGLLDPQEGGLYVDGTEVTDENVDRWQQNIGYVPQDINLIDDTIRRNIAFALPDEEIDPASVKRAAKVAHIHDFIANELPDGYDTVVGEEGVRLSGGQRQRIGIARALYENPPVLVLDEATSDVDRRTEAHITRAIEELAGEKTLITIAHRLSTIQECDRIYVLEDGRIVDEGTFDQLTDSSPTFRKFTQTLEAAEPVGGGRPDPSG